MKFWDRQGKQAAPRSESVEWTNEEGESYRVARVNMDTVSVACGQSAIGRVRVPTSLPSLSDATRAQLRAIVEAAMRLKAVRRWNDDGGAVPGIDPPG